MPLTQQTFSVAQLLKKNTMEAHLESENLLVPYLNSIRSLEDYAKILKMFYGFFHPVEGIIHEHIDCSVLNDIEERRNSKLIIGDLETIADHGRPLLSNDLPAIDSFQKALGAMYVLEGSTLGGRMIARMLMKLPFINENNLAFFNGYKEMTGEKWTAFQVAINRYEEDAPAIIMAANETFELFTRWMRQTLANESEN